jgi:hypothetical protein
MIGFLGTLWGRLGVAAVLVSMLALWRLDDIGTQREVGARKVTSAIAKQTEQQSEKARKARTAARSVDDAVKRVRDAYCVDCQ